MVAKTVDVVLTLAYYIPLVEIVSCKCAPLVSAHRRIQAPILNGALLENIAAHSVRLT